MLPASPYYPTPQSPALAGTPNGEMAEPSTGSNGHLGESGGGTFAGLAHSSKEGQQQSGKRLHAINLGLAAMANEESPSFRLSPWASTNQLIDSLPSPVSMPELPPLSTTAEESNRIMSIEPEDINVKLEETLFGSTSPVPAALPSPSNRNSPSAASALMKAEDEDRKPSLPPPFPFASTSASVQEIDEKRYTASGSESRSGSGTPVVGMDTGEDSEDKPITVKKRGRKGKAKVIESEPQFIGDLPAAEEAAASTYVELPECTYANKKLGDMAYYDEDAQRCDCTYHPTEADEEQACGDHSNCMNRLMQIECMKGDCKCGRHCQNQRFQKKQYAPITIVQTEKKGFGVRAEEDMPADTFVYEYLGEVIGPQPFQRKMKEYATEGIKHFYFMALDKDVFIDATKKGGKGRFLNHSCNPNCVVAKWTVGRKMRMGIFTKRAIQKHEELTFNYNVDRYGHSAQECYCGEPNCVGYIGGKTQTDLGGMDDLYIDALGITEEVEALGLKGSKKKKGRKLDEDFVPTLYPIQLDEVPKVSAAMRQAIQTRRILEKLLTRVQMTIDEEVQRNLLRLHGLNLMHNILREYPSDIQVITLDLQILSQWRLQTRNKIESSNIEESVQKCVEVEDEKVKSLASEILTTWGELKLGYRIPKAELDGDRKRASNFNIDQITKRPRLEDLTPAEEEDRPAFVRPTASTVNRERRRLPQGWQIQYDRENDRDFFVNSHTGQRQYDFPRGDAVPPPSRRPPTVAMTAADLVAQAESAAKAEAEAEAKRVAEEKQVKEQERAERHKARKSEKEDKERERKEKKVMGLFSGVVVSTMSKYKSQFGDSEAFKKRAKEVSQILCNKEKKRPSFATDAYDSLTPDKEAKLKAFVKDWVKKLLERKKKGGSASSTPKRPGSGTPNTPNLTAGSSAMEVDMEIGTPTGSGDAGEPADGGSQTPSGTPPPKDGAP
ncbi:hypothetical protein JCM11641_003634 [Rhodosporidiobolus odoratus]